MDIICIGEILVDFIPGELPHTYICKAGGAPANVAVAAARNGLDAGVCGRVGADTFGDFLESTLRANGVTFLTPQRVSDAVTTMAFVWPVRFFRKWEDFTASGNGCGLT